MATYKLIQDIEAEDHILGPLSLRQFIFALVAIFFFYLCFVFITKHVAFLLVISLPPALFFGFFAMPFGRDQPTEVWALAKLRFWFKPRRRIWDQSGVKELVTITAPKKIERVLTNGLDQDQVRSRLSALASTIDSRGWAIKNVNVGTYAMSNPLMHTGSDRLIDVRNFPQEVPNDDLTGSYDILDTTNSPIAQQFDQMINQSAQTHRQDLINQMNTPSIPAAPVAQAATTVVANDYWFTGKSSAASSPVPAYQAPVTTETSQAVTQQEKELTVQLHAKHSSQEGYTSHLRTLQPIAQPRTEGAEKTTQTQAQSPVTAPADPAILSLANNNDLNVATIAREASKAKGEEPPDEVVISLH